MSGADYEVTEQEVDEGDVDGLVRRVGDLATKVMCTLCLQHSSGSHCSKAYASRRTCLQTKMMKFKHVIMAGQLVAVQEGAAEPLRHPRSAKSLNISFPAFW